MRSSIGIATFLAIGAGAVSVSALNLLGSDTLKDLTITLLTSSTLECGGVGEPTSDGVAGSLVYEGTGSGNGQSAMLAGTQDVAPMSSRMSTAVCTQGAGKAEGIVFALDAISIVARDTTAANTAGSCAGSKSGCGTDLNPTKGLRITFAGDPSAAPPALTSCTSAQVVDWRDVLRLIYFGYDASNLTAQNCASACRTELANGYSKLFQASCTVGNSCTQLKHAFRRNDESGTTDVFVKALGVPAINQKDNFSPFCNNGTTGPAIIAATLPSCAANADCNPGGTAGGTCDTNSANRTFDKCTKLGCSASSPCPGGATCTTAGICDLETNSSAQKNIGAHNLGGCESSADCSSGTCDAASSRCSCTASTDCPAAGTCTGGLCVPAATSTPEPGHINETNATTGYGPGGAFVDLQDADPIRRACSFSAGQALEDVCNRDGKLGLVLPVWDATTTGSSNPNVQAVTAADAFPSLACDTGKFACYQATAFTRNAAGSSVFDLCPDGSNPNAVAGTNLCPPGQCARPIHLSGATQDPRCVSGRGNLAPPLAAPNDGRVYNLVVWQQNPTSGQFLAARYPRSTGQGSTNLYGPVGFVTMNGAYFRLHSQTPTISGSGACQSVSATDQIGCLVQASWCSVGYAGNSAVNGATTSINVNNITAFDNTCTQNLITGAGPVYPIARRLFLNSVNGFESINPALNPGESNDKKNEYKLAQCYGLDDDGAGPHGEAAKIATANPPAGFGFIPLPGAAFCDDVSKNVCGGATAACANNTDAIPTNSVVF